MSPFKDHPESGRLNLRQATAYGSGSIATGIFATAPGLFLLFYMTEVLAISPFLAGFAFFLPRIWDVITDPLIGTISDRTRSRFGRRRPYMFAAALTAPLCFAAIFWGPDSSDPFAAFLHVAAAYALTATFFTAFSIPYIAMPAEFTDLPAERTRVLAFRMAALVIGILMAGALGPELLSAGGGGIEGYRLMGIVLAAIMTAAMLYCVFGTAGTRHVERSSQRVAFTELARAVGSNRPFRALLLAFALQSLAIGAMLSMLPYFSSYILQGDEGTTTILFLCLVLPSLLTMPFWVWFARKSGKTIALAASTTLFLGSTLVLLAAHSGQVVIAYIAVGGMGLGYAGTQLFPFSILSDVVADDRASSSQTREGAYTGLWTACEKSCNAAGGFFAATLLGLFGFLESAGGVRIDQPASALDGIRWAFVVFPAAMLMLSLPILMRLHGALARPHASMEH
ncbi:MFS transporter [Thalassococcus sp. S3]|uniref:MFS transporter n=1 Tax=Thalassococcus sp. S3 TaxID=2017482 RepID=UPI001023FD1F|nr:MFS transporter [Thalassococcus sp. S3]QBF33667.1 MFS transporter [Thalassococcus sp. S3]